MEFHKPPRLQLCLQFRRVQPIIVGMSWWQESEAARKAIYTLEAGSIECYFAFSYVVLDHSLWDGITHMKGGFSYTDLPNVETPSRMGLQACFFDVKLTVMISHHSRQLIPCLH